MHKPKIFIKTTVESSVTTSSLLVVKFDERQANSV